VKPVKAVIWDFGGVITSSPFDAFNRFERERSLPPDFIRTVNAANHLENGWAKIERGEISPAEFDTCFADESRAMGHEVRGADVVALLQGTPREDMVEALRRISARMPTGCITNNLPPAFKSGIHDMYREEIMGLFHHVVESAKCGLRKPDPRIYRLMTDALNVDPTDCVYLDDLGINLKPAREMGMRTIKVVNHEIALNELENYVGFSLR
jgi:putative hydrolase of the HAD superfamily